MEGGLLTSLQRTSSIQGLLGQQLSSSQLSFSGAVAPPPLPGPERFCTASLLENSGHRAGQRAGLGQGGGLHYESHLGKWSFSGRKGFNGPAALEGEGGTVQTIRTQVRGARCFVMDSYGTSDNTKVHVFHFVVTAYSSCTPPRGQSDTRSSGSHSDIGSNLVDHREPPHPPSGIHRAAFT